MRFIYLLLVLVLFANQAQAAVGQHAMVVTSQNYATQVGVEILKKGGNAIDAAVAIGYALAVVDPCCGNIGGGGFMLIHFANGKNTFINFREKAPAAISPQLFLDKNGDFIQNKSIDGYLAVGVPGTVLGLNTALKKYGTLPLPALIQPAIDLAQNGFILTPGHARRFKNNSEKFKAQPNVAAIFLKNNKLYKSGDRLVQKDLAATLKLIANQGSNIFYNGKIADEIVAASQKNGGVLSKKDFKNYSVSETQPIACTYHDHKIITTPPPGGGITLCEILNISEGYPLKTLGFHNVLSTHYVVEAMRYTYADRNTYMGDPKFIKIPVQKLISKKHAESIREKILPNKAGNSYVIGFTSDTKEKTNTTSYVVVDPKGNAVSVTYTLNDDFGANVIAGNTGFFLNSEIDDFAIKTDAPNLYGLIQGKNNLVAPNKQPLSSMAPTVILKDEQLFMVIGTPGGSTIPTQLAETIQNVIDFNMPLEAAVNSSRFHMQWLPDQIFMEPDTFSITTLVRLKIMGYQFKVGSPFGTQRWGAVTAIIKNSQTHSLEGVMDNRKPAGSALGY